MAHGGSSRRLSGHSRHKPDYEMRANFQRAVQREPPRLTRDTAALARPSLVESVVFQGPGANRAGLPGHPWQEDPVGPDGTPGPGALFPQDRPLLDGPCRLALTGEAIQATHDARNRWSPRSGVVADDINMLLVRLLVAGLHRLPCKLHRLHIYCAHISITPRPLGSAFANDRYIELG